MVSKITMDKTSLPNDGLGDVHSLQKLSTSTGFIVAMLFTNSW
jgi:hypothetical protein